MKCLFPVRMHRSTIDGTISHSSHKVNSPTDVWRRCGQCINCKLHRSQSWAIRLTHESKMHERSCFVTLTYSDDNLPKFGSLNYDDVTLFIKKLRSFLDYANKKPISYFYVGEYGTNFSRPHYHLCLFGTDFSDDIVYKGKKNKLEISSKSGDHSYYKSSFATDLWSSGFVDIGTLNFQMAMYVSKYVTKSLRSNEYYAIEPEVARMSKRNILGTSYLSKFYRDIYPNDYVLINDKKLSPPAAYDRWLEKNHPNLWSEVKQKREDSVSTPEFSDSLYPSHFIRVQKQKTFTRDGCAPNLRTDEEMLLRHKSNISNFKDYL